MSSRRLVASAPIRPIVMLPVLSLRRRHLHPYPSRLPSRSDPARCRLLHDYARPISRVEALTPLAPSRASAARRGRTTRSRVPVLPVRGDACDRRGTRGWGGRSARPGGSPTDGIGNTHSGSSAPGCCGRPSQLRPEIESPGSASSRLRESAPSRRRCFVAHPGFVTFHGSAAPHNSRNSGFFPVVASRGSLHRISSGQSLNSPPRRSPGRNPPENLDACDSCWDTDAAP